MIVNEDDRLLRIGGQELFPSREEAEAVATLDARGARAVPLYAEPTPNSEAEEGGETAGT